MTHTPKFLSNKDAAFACIALLILTLIGGVGVKSVIGNPFNVPISDWGIAFCIAAMMASPLIGTALFLMGRFNQDR